jgi:hypothetical protein
LSVRFRAPLQPSYEYQQSKLRDTFAAQQLVASAEAGTQNVKASWIDAYKAYQYVAIYGFGRQEIFLKQSAQYLSNKCED